MLLAALLGLCGMAGLHAYTCFHYQKLVPGSKYAIASPSWPLNYLPTESCQWVAEAPADHRVSIECDDFFLPGLHSNESRSCCDALLASETGSHIGMDGMPFIGQGVMITYGNVLNVELRSSPKTGSEGRFHCYLAATQDHQWDLHNRAANTPGPPAEPCPCGWRLDGRGSTLAGRLTGGQEMKPNEFPMMAALTEGSVVFCGAVLVSSRHALTSAHCLRGKSMDVIDLVVGDYDFSQEPEASGPSPQRHKLADFVRHPAWSGDWKRANIAIAKTKEEIRFSFFVAPACMPSRTPDNAIINGDTLLAMGWGAETYFGSTSNRVKYMHTFLQDNKECESKYSVGLQEEHFCIGTNKGQAVCSGDPGGPLLLEDPKTHRLTVVGIIAYGEGCTGAPIINTRVSSYLDWIKDVTGSK